MTGQQVLSAISKRLSPSLPVFEDHGGKVALTGCVKGPPGLIGFLAVREPVADLGFFACSSEDNGVAAIRFLGLGSGIVALGCCSVCDFGSGAGGPDNEVAAGRFFGLGSSPVVLLGCSSVCTSGEGAGIPDVNVVYRF